MFVGRWVHRDISSGNILGLLETSADGERYQTKLGDLEYARRYPPADDYVAGNDPKMGTPFFMPCEILLGAPFRDEEDGEAGEDDDLFQGVSQKVVAPIIHHFLHDLESVWWIAVWTLLTRISHGPAKGLADRIFRNDIRAYKDSARIKLFKKISIRPHVLTGLETAAEVLENSGGKLRHRLYEHGRALDLGSALDSDAVGAIHSRGFATMFPLFAGLPGWAPVFDLTPRPAKAADNDQAPAGDSAEPARRKRGRDDAEFHTSAESSSSNKETEPKSSKSDQRCGAVVHGSRRRWPLVI
ncbi:other/FunK1 protein kinase [Coprinopsis cinerea AmutBmut pab1-1]|nr:other/FunK1 protein kinase [Coprinopsis cinerea AmutBmut pab1-1]